MFVTPTPREDISDDEERKDHTISHSDVDVEISGSKDASVNDNESVDISQRAPLITSKSVDTQDTKVKSPQKMQVLDYHTIMQRRKEWSRGIQTYQLSGGKFRNRISDEELKRQLELEEMRKRQLEELEEE